MCQAWIIRIALPIPGNVASQGVLGMNIASIIGPVDPYSAVVAVVIFGGMTIFSTALVVKRQNRHKLDNDLKLAMFNTEKNVETSKYVADTEKAKYIAKTNADRDVKFKEYEQGLLEMKTVPDAESGRQYD